MNTPTPKVLQVDIADVSGQIFSGPCVHLVAPAALGEVCILPRHAPFLTKLLPGVVKLETVLGERLFFYVSGGYMEVQNSEVTVLADQMVRSQDLDREAALAAIAHAQEVLKKARLFRDRDRAKLELVKALAQLRAVEQLEKAHKHSR